VQTIQQEEKKKEEKNAYMVSPPINIHWSVATVITAIAATSLGMLGILCIIMWLIQQGPVLVQPDKETQPMSYEHSSLLTVLHSLYTYASSEKCKNEIHMPF
jgi:hypothetical protein